MDKNAGAWDGLKRRWKKWKGKRKFTGPTPSEDQVVDHFADDFVEHVLWPSSTSFLRQVVLEANKAGIPSQYLPYVFWALVDGRKWWPNMHPMMVKGLRIALSLVRSQGDMPNYRGALSTPPPEMHTALDQTIKGLAMWTLNGWAPSLIGGYTKMLKKWERQMVRAVGDSLPSDKAMAYLKVLFEGYLRKQPGRFLDGMLLERVVFDLLF